MISVLFHLNKRHYFLRNKHGFIIFAAQNVGEVAQLVRASDS